MKRRQLIPREPSNTKPTLPFWKAKKPHEMTEAEWESLCDGCGKCCLIGLEDADTGEIYLTDVACDLLDRDSARCSDYANRRSRVPDCVKLTPDNVPSLHWIPKTCAYRLVAEGRDLYWWHPLVSGDPDSVHAANVSVQGKVRAQGRLKARALMRRITQWPEPRPRRPAPAKGGSGKEHPPSAALLPNGDVSDMRPVRSDHTDD